MTQGSLFHPTQAGEQPTLEARLVVRRTDPEAVKEVVMDTLPALNGQERCAYRLVSTYGPGTTWEIAKRALADPYLTTQKSLEETHYLLARRCVNLERKTLVTCGRVRDPTGRTVRRDEKVCAVKGNVQAVWRAWEVVDA